MMDLLLLSGCAIVAGADGTKPVRADDLSNATLRREPGECRGPGSSLCG